MSSRTRALLKFGQWPDIKATKEPVELTAAARALALNAIEELGRLGVTVTLDGFNRARFRCRWPVMPVAVRRIVEAKGDLIEACLQQERTQ
jgi:hypothetical protein